MVFKPLIITNFYISVDFIATLWAHKRLRVSGWSQFDEICGIESYWDG